MVEVGARFTNKLYAKLSLDLDNGDGVVTMEIITNEGEVQTNTGTVTWDEDDGGGLG